MVRKMTEGSPIKLILAFMVPLLIGNLFQQFYNIADIIIVGRIMGFMPWRRSVRRHRYFLFY